MRAAWSRRTDEELLHAFFLEELSTAGRTMIEQLVIEKVGPLDAYLARFEREQGAIIAAFPVRGCEMADVPAMWGHIVLTANGIGFLAEGVEESLASELASDVAGFGFTFLSGGLIQSAAMRILEDTSGDPPPVRRSSFVPSGRIAPLPLLASIEPRFAWIPRAQIDELESRLPRGDPRQRARALRVALGGRRRGRDVVGRGARDPAGRNRPCPVHAMIAGCRQAIRPRARSRTSRRTAWT